MQQARIFSTSSNSKNALPNTSNKQLRTSLTYRSRPTMMSSSNTMRSQVGTTITIGKRAQHTTIDTSSTYHEINESDKHKPFGTQSPNESYREDGQNSEHDKRDRLSISDPIQMTLWFHELRTSAEDVIIDMNSMPGLQDGDICELRPIAKADSELNRRQRLIFIARRLLGIGKETKIGGSGNAPNSLTHASSNQNVGSNKFSTVSKGKAFQISLLANPLQNLLDLVPRSLVLVRIIKDSKEVLIDTLEILISVVNLPRDQMWILSSQLNNTCVYMDKRISFLDSRIGVVKGIYKNGKEIISGYVSPQTKVVYRSKSAKVVLLIQLSREMWNFEETGEILFHKLVNTLFPKIFRNWRNSGVHHSISIVLFTSVDRSNTPWTSLEEGERPNSCQDYFRVVVDQVSIYHWDKIMTNLRLEFACFKRDVLLSKTEDGKYKLKGQPLPSVKGNVLEAINLGITMGMDRFRNTDLKHSVSNLILITPGTGIFDVDYDLMLSTSTKMTNIDSALDIISLSQQPLHIVPLFRFKDPSKQHRISYCVPHWCDISFYSDRAANSTQWIPRCKIYELQMMGVMDNRTNQIKIERLSGMYNKPILEAMDQYDDTIFKTERKHHSVSNSSFSLFSDRSNRSKPLKKYDKNVMALVSKDKSAIKANTSTSKSNASTSNTVALGTVSNVNKEMSALSSLYTLKKPEDTLLKPKPSTNFDADRTSSLRTIGAISSRFNQKSAPITRNINSEKVTRNIDKFQERNRSDASALSRGDITDGEGDNEKHGSILWTEIVNPSREQKLGVLRFLKLGRWNDVFPPRTKREIVQWRSYETPAELPITTKFFPSKSQLETEFTFQIYSIFLNSENEFGITTTYSLMREMVCLRLLLGFQICYGDDLNNFQLQNKSVNGQEALVTYIPNGNCYGCVIYMSLAEEIHRISCDYNGNLFVQLYCKKPTDQKSKPLTLGQTKGRYAPFIRTRYIDEYAPAKEDYLKIEPVRYNWNQFDQLLAGYTDAVPSDKKRFHKMKFVVLPSDIPKNAFYITNENLTDEEIRVEGLRKLIFLIERDRYPKSQDEKDKRKEEISPEIHFYTGNLYEFLREQAEAYDIAGNNPGNSLILASSLRFTRDISLDDLAQEMQGARGLKLVDRTWHFKKHLRCFLGSELVTWIIENFEDIDDREEATKFGQSLMDKKMFKHVEHRHRFLDGYYFYEFEENFINKSYKDDKNTSSWFRKKNSNEKNELSKQVTDPELVKSPLMSQDGSDFASPKWDNSCHMTLDSETSSFADSTITKPKQKRKFNLSNSVRCNIDAQHKSYKTEVITVHYDRVHNPEHCYHIRLEWLNTSPKLIDDTIVNWSRLCERHGLKLVEMPWNELCTLPSINPFHSFIEISLLIDPWHDEEFRDAKMIEDNKFYYHLYLLKYADFLLDNRSAVFFRKEGIEISYSWGNPTFQYAQFIHKSGTYLVEIKDNGELFLAPNNVHINRINSNLASSTELDNMKGYHLDAQDIMLNFRDICSNEHILRHIFREAKQDWGMYCEENVLPIDI